MFSFKKDELKGAILRCPLCKTQKKLRVRNCGFVNAEWQMRGIMKKNKESKIYADGRTYDGKLYTFKECDYVSVWDSLEVLAKKMDNTSVQNIQRPEAAEKDKEANDNVEYDEEDEEGMRSVTEEFPNTQSIHEAQIELKKEHIVPSFRVDYNSARYGELSCTNCTQPADQTSCSIF